MPTSKPRPFAPNRSGDASRGIGLRHIAVAIVLSLAGIALGYSTKARSQQAPQTAQTQVFNAWTRIGRAPDLSAGTSTGNTILNFAAPVARVCNIGSVAAYVALGGVSIAATLAGGDVVLPNTCISLNATGATYIAAIVGSSTAVVQTTLGTGSP